jgi:hypothetical protein
MGAFPIRSGQEGQPRGGGGTHASIDYRHAALSAWHLFRRLSVIFWLAVGN